MLDYGRRFEQLKQRWHKLVLNQISTTATSIWVQAPKPFFRLLRAVILSARPSYLQRTLPLLWGLDCLNERTKMPFFSAVETIAKLGKVVRPDWNGLSVLLLNAAQAAALDLGLLSKPTESIQSAKFLYLMGADDVSLEKLPDDAFVVYQGHHGDKSVYRANVIFPSVAFSEKEGTYENTEGCSQWTVPAVPTVGDARDDWKIIRALSEVAGVRLPYDNLDAVRARLRMVAPNLLHVDEREQSTVSAALKPEFHQQLSLAPFGTAVEKFYMTDSITRASKIMAQCSSMLLK